MLNGWMNDPEQLSWGRGQDAWWGLCSGASMGGRGAFLVSRVGGAVFCVGLSERKLLWSPPSLL